nr:hypothetical protein BaRGS_015403 [Batillaria attramentaria]
MAPVETVACKEDELSDGDVKTGDIEDFPGLDSLPKFEAMSSTAESIALRSQDFFSSCDIEFRTGTEVSATFGDQGNYSPPLMSSRTTLPRTMPIPGIDLKNVCVLRTPDDANRIAANSEGKNVVIIGSSFMLHESKGVKFYFERGIKEFRGKDGQLTQAVLSDDTVLDADLCVLGIGRVAALNMLGKKVDVHSVPYFWTVMYGKSLRGDKVVAVASLAFDPIVSQAASLMEQGQVIMKSEIMYVSYSFPLT